MGVMQVTRPLKPQGSRSAVYLADRPLQRKYSLKTDDVAAVSHKQNTCLNVTDRDNDDESTQVVWCTEKATGSAKRDNSSSLSNSRPSEGRIALENNPYSFANKKDETCCLDGDARLVFQNSHFTEEALEQSAERIGNDINEHVDVLLKSYRKTKAIFGDCKHTDLESPEFGVEKIRKIKELTSSIEGEIVRHYSLKKHFNKYTFHKAMKRVTRRRVPDLKIQACGRGRPRKKSLGKRGGNSGDKPSQDGNEGGEGRPNRNRQQRGQGNGCGGGSGGGRRRRDDDDRDDDNDDVDDDFDENNEDEDDEEDEQTGTESVADETELSPEQEAEMAQELMCLIPPKNMNCDPPEKPAKPGTVVNVHGVVLHETTGGLVVLNVRWRNKIYSGALIDVRKSRWASERIKPDPFPEGANPKPADLIKLNGKRKGKKSKSPELADKDAKEGGDLNTDQTFKEPTGVPVAFKRPSDSGENGDPGVKKKARLSPPIECPEPNCGKRYSHKNGLKYHQARAHQNKSESEDSKALVAMTTQKASIAISEPTSTTSIAQQKTLLDPKPEIGHLPDVNPTTQIISSAGEGANLKATAILTSPQTVVPFSAACPKPNADFSKTVVAPIINIKTEEENAVDSIRDVKFEESEKIKENAEAVPKIMLESTTGEEPTELTGASDGSRMDMARPESLFSMGNQAGLVPFNSRVNYAQFSPTLNPLNPQTLNNSLSNALQTASSKSDEKFESDPEKRVKNDDAENGDHNEGNPAKLQLEDISPVDSAPDAVMRRIGFNKDAKSEDMVPSSPDEPKSLSDLLPGSLGPHLFPKESKNGGATGQSTSAFGSDQAAFPASHFSVSLYNQLRQGHASRLLMGDSVTGDLAEPSDIQRAMVDVRRHFSPMLLNYLNTGSRAREGGSENESNADEVSTSLKIDAIGKPVKKNERRDATSPSSTSFMPMTTGGRADPSLMRRDKPPGNLQQKPEFLQPNISAGRPIVKPATKPESITGGLKISGGSSRFGAQGQYVAGGDKQAEETGQGESQFSGDRASTPKNLSPTSYVDKQMIEAKTWVPKEVYWQPPQKKTPGQERTQFSPGKEKAGKELAIAGRMGGEFEKKAGSPYDHGAMAAEYMKKIEQGASPGQSIKKAKQSSSSIPYPSPAMSSSSSDSERLKQNELHPDNGQDVPEISRFTLTGERLVPSPAENRGRPRKIRVEKTQQIPVGSAKDIEGSRGAPDHGSRKQTTTCSYTRTSVIHSMSTPPEELRTVTPVKEEYVSPEGKRKSPAVPQDRLAYEKKVKQDFRKAEANRIFEAEREKLKNRHVESHYANEVRNMQMRAQELQALPKAELALRGSVSPSSRFQSLSVSALDKIDRHARERLETKSIPVSPAYGQGTSYSSHPPSDIEKFRSEFLQHEFHRLPAPFAGSMPHVEGYPGLPTSYPGSSYYGQRPGLSQADVLAHQRFEQLISSHMDQEKAFSKYSSEKSEQVLKMSGEHGKHPHAERMRPSSRDGHSHSHRPPFYPHASPIGFQSREPSNPSRSPKGSPFGYRLGEMLAASRPQRMESDIISKDSKPGIGDGRRDARRDFGNPYGLQFFQPSYQYSGLGSNKPFSQRMSEQPSPYKHPAELEKARYPPHSSSQAHSGPGGMLSANLVLTKADSLGYGSVHYDGRNPDKK